VREDASALRSAGAEPLFAGGTASRTAAGAIVARMLLLSVRERGSTKVMATIAATVAKNGR
jgi:hypothetical protein